MKQSTSRQEPVSVAAIGAGLFLAAVAVLPVLAGNASAQTLLERGSYLVNGIMTCNNCHTPRTPDAIPIMERQLSGGAQIFNEPQFSVKGSNITPDRESGIGKWSEADFKRAMTQGVRPNGVPLAMVMPFSLFKVLTPRDLDAVWVYVRSIPPVRNEVQHAVYKAEQKSPVYPGADKPMTEEDLRDRVKRGLYLGSIGHCMACHAGRKDDLPDFQNQAGKGGRVFKGPYGTATAANITSHREKGLGAWTDAEIKRALLQSVSRDGRPLAPPMAQYARYYNRLTDADLDAIVAWLRSLPALE